MHRCFVAIVALSCVLTSGCATSATIKDASTKHASNLVGLHQAVAEYRKKVDEYYYRLIAQQREAYIAMHVNKWISAMAEEQAQSIANEMHPAIAADEPKGKKPANDQKPANDFIQAGAKITDEFDRWRRNFDLWVEETEGKDLSERRGALKKVADELEKKGDVETAKKVRAEANQSEDHLTFVSVAIDLKKQRANLDNELGLLAAQVATMQAFHEKINDFLAIDATIDGAKIAAAAAAGSKADVAGILRKK